MKRNLTRKNHIIWRRLVTGVVVLAIAVCLTGIGLLVKAQFPYFQARHEATQMAEKYAHVDKVSHFYWYNRNQTYFTIAGQNDKGQNVYVIIPKNGASVNVYSQRAGISAQQAAQVARNNDTVRKVQAPTLGMHAGKPAWEVAYLNKQNEQCYVLLSFKTGKVIQQNKGI